MKQQVSVEFDGGLVFKMSSEKAAIKACQAEPKGGHIIIDGERRYVAPKSGRKVYAASGALENGPS